MTVMDLREKAGCWSGCDGCGSCTGGAPDTTVQPREGDALPPEEDACACGCKVCSEAKVNP